jgi:hypothetical protein
MPTLRPTLFAAALAALAIAPANLYGFDAGHQVTPDFADARATIDAAVAAHGAERVLVVFDVDNTILATDQDLGGEHWYLWQEGLIKSADPGAVAPSVDALLRVQGWIYALTRMHAVEPRIPLDVAELSRTGVRFMALTSRGPELHDVTLRELARNGFDLAATAPGPHGGYAGAYLPYDPAAPAAAGLTADDVARLGLKAPKPVTFHDGIMLTSGQHKGAMLRTLLAKTSAQFDAIVFVDDREHHSQGMQAAFANRPEEVHTVRYVHELAHIEAFQASDKHEAKAQWCALGTALATAFGPSSEFVACPR